MDDVINNGVTFRLNDGRLKGLKVGTNGVSHVTFRICDCYGHEEMNKVIGKFGYA